ncbi:hypothetical protein CFC21_033505 [Triticum aestivum]|uniref:Uncharacterized protein n=2 Tax=Triticum aestivum TaxID=4565 RepID=A0A9R1F2A1_WHEAT|nr:hypothetical protein CFC21_033505 [Triticum aestivum]
MVRSTSPATNGDQSCRTDDREGMDEDKATVTPQPKSKGIKQIPNKTKLLERSGEEEIASIQIWTVEHFQDLQQLAFNRQQIKLSDSRSRCRAPFNPNSGQPGIEAAPRSCKPQAYLLAFRDRIVGTMNKQLHKPFGRPFIGMIGAPPQNQIQNKPHRSKKTKQNKICAVVHKRKPRTKSTTIHGGYAGKNLVDNRPHLWG